MKTIGLIGGMSWESSVEYYRLLNLMVKERLGGLHSARCVMLSVDFAEIEVMQHQGRWEEAARVLNSAARSLEAAGAGLLLLCTNTMHKVADGMMAGVGIPLLHIADATAEKVKAARLRRVGLLGTRYTMEEDFYRGRLSSRHGLEVRIPAPQDRVLVNRVIFEELCLGKILPESRASFVRIIAEMVRDGAEGIIAGCTEVGLLVKPEDCAVPLFDTTRIHAEAAVEWALANAG